MPSLRFILACCLCLPGLTLVAQPIIHATSKEVAIRDGGHLDRTGWWLSPETDRDLYVANRSRKPQWLTFYTDIDSIRTLVKPGSSFDFIVLLNGKDTCRTQIVSALPKRAPAVPKKHVFPVKIPFVLSPDDALLVQAVLDRRDTLTLHFDIGSYGFHVTKEALVQKTELLSHQVGVSTGITKPDFGDMKRVHKIQMGGEEWDDPHLWTAEMAAKGADGRFGWKVFDNRIVEIDYEQRCLIVHDAFPKHRVGYTKGEVKFIGTMFCIAAQVEAGGNAYPGTFLFDSGSNLAVVLDSAWASSLGFPTKLKVLKSSAFRDGAGREYVSKVVSVPAVHVQGVTMRNVPTLMMDGESPAGEGVNCFGNDFLKRFNVIIDLQRDLIYLKPNSLQDVPYR